MLHRLFAPLLLVGCVAAMASAADKDAPNDAKNPIKGIGPVEEIKTLKTDFQFTEGPTGDAAGNVYFTDIPANRIYKVTPAGKFSVFQEPSSHTNGLMLVGDSQMLACQMDGQIVSIDMADKSVTVVAGKHKGKRFNACNDLVPDSHGGVYFTDPRFRAPDPWPQGKEAFYYVDAKGKVKRLGDDLAAPNGVILSPNEKTLYVIPSMSSKMMAYDVKGPGKLGKGRVFCELKQAEGAENGGGDGLTIDTKGNLYITSKLGIQVFNPKGKLLGIIAFPQQPANVAFVGKDRKTLFVTARTGVYSVKMNAVGHIFPGKPAQAKEEKPAKPAAEKPKAKPPAKPAKPAAEKPKAKPPAKPTKPAKPAAAKNDPPKPPAPVAQKFDPLKIHGEYVGQVRGQAVGVQVAAYGKGEYIGRYYVGGLPGAGYNHGVTQPLVGEEEADAVRLYGCVKPTVFRIADGAMTVTDENANCVGTLKRIVRTSPTAGLKAPSDATVLFAGELTDNLKDAKLTDEGLLDVGFMTAMPVEDFRLHIEFRTPFMPEARGQKRGNSGVYIQQRYEVQILDAFANAPAKNEVASLYRQQEPDFNMSYPPMQWQTYDIYFQAARFSEDGKEKTENAKITVFHNGVAVHYNREIANKTGAGKPEGPQPMPILFQNHSDPVRYRNMWIELGNGTP